MSKELCKHCGRNTKFEGITCTRCGGKKRNWKKIQFTVIIFVIVLLIFGIRALIPEENPNPNNLTESQLQCLEQNYDFYGTQWCKFCNQQKKIFGELLTKKVYTDCEENSLKCSDIGVESVPYHMIFKDNGSNIIRLNGVQDISKIINLTGCE